MDLGSRVGLERGLEGHFAGLSNSLQARPRGTGQDSRDRPGLEGQARMGGQAPKRRQESLTWKEA